MSVKIAVTYGYGSNLRNKFSVVVADTSQQAYEKIGSVTEGRYAFSYVYDADFEKQIADYGLTEVPLQPHHIHRR